MIDVRIEAGTTATAIRELARTIRPLEREDYLRAFDSVEEGLWYGAAHSVLLGTGYVNDQVAAIWGVGEPTYIAETLAVQAPWFAMAEHAEAYPTTVLRESRRWLEGVKKRFPVLYNWVPVEDEPAQRYLEFLGFEVYTDRVHERGGGEYYAFKMET